jgi:site-specific recombinase XerD
MRDGESGDTLLVNAVDTFLAQIRRSGLSEATHRIYRGALACLLRHLKQRGIRAIQRVRPSHMAGWVLFLKTGTYQCRLQPEPASYKPSTAYTYILIARRFFSWLVEQGELLTNPARGLITRDLASDVVARLQIPTEAQMRVLLDQAHKERLCQIRDWAVMELLYSSGLRIGEVRALNVTDVDLTDRLVRVRQGKGRKDRVVPLGRPACTALEIWLDEIRPQMAIDRAEQALFVTALGRRFGYATFFESIKVFRKRIGLTRMRAHDLRHASAVHMLRHGADLRYIQEFLGHSSFKSTQVYTRLVPDDLKAVHRKTHPRERHKDRP